MFHESLLIPIFTRSKESPLAACSQAVQTALCYFQFFIVLRSLLSVIWTNIIDLLKPTLFRIIIRFRVWGSIDTCFIDPRTQLLIIYEVCLIRSLRVERTSVFFQNLQSIQCFREDFLDPLIESRSKNTYPLFIVIIHYNPLSHAASYMLSYISPCLHGLQENEFNEIFLSVRN